MISSLPVETLQAPRARRIRKLSQGLAALCPVLALVLATGLLGYWLVTPDDVLHLDARLPGIAIHPVDWPVRLAALAISAIPLSGLIWGLLRARQCLLKFAAGDFFAVEAVSGLRDIAIAIFASTLLKPLAGGALSILLSWKTYASGKALVFNVGSDTLLALIFAGLIAVIAWVMAEAQAIVDEHQQFV